MTETTFHSDGDAHSDRNPETNNNPEANNDPRSPAEQAKVREREMEESGEENAA